MDTPLSENRSSNLLVYVAAGAAVIALVLGIIGLVQVSKVKQQLGAVNLTELDTKISQADARASAASTEARGAKNDVRTLQTLMERELNAQFSDIRNNLTRIEEMAKQASQRPAPAVASGAAGNGSPPASGGSGGASAAAPGQLEGDGTYVIKSGDMLGKIGAQFGVSWQEIVRANPGLDPNRLRVGQKIVIPQRQ